MNKLIQDIIIKNGKYSSKRILGVVIVHLFEVIISDTIIWALVTLKGTGFGFSTVEKFNNIEVG